MDQLVKFTLDELARQESETRVIAKRDLANEALRLLREHQAGLGKAYPMVLLEMFADGPSAPETKPVVSSALDFGELSLVDDDEVQAQVELSRAQQIALHTTEEILSQLNGLVSAAQGLPRVQPERNPLRPENYIRALQRAVADTQVIAPVREAWMQHMRAYLGEQLVGVYERAVKGLRDHGVEQVGWGTRVAASQPSYPQGGGYQQGSGWYGPGGNAGAAGSGWAPTSAWSGGAGGHTGYHTTGAPDYAPSGQEALLTVSILRQMLAGADDPYMELRAQSGPGGSVYAGVQQPMVAHGADRYAPAGASEALEDIAQLERLVGRLANSQPAHLHSGQGVPRSNQASLYGAAEAAPMGAEVVARMVENISQDSRLLPPVQQAVQNLEPAIRKLIRTDPRFFTDASHPARLLLDEITQRSLAFTHVEAPGFSRFMRLIDQAVAHLSKAEITSAAPFETVRRALQAAWEAQEKKRAARQEREKRELLMAEEREMRAERVAQEIGALPELEGAPQDIVDFVLGPWVEVVAAPPPDASGRRNATATSALALVSLLLWSVRPELARDDPDRLDEAAMLLPVRVRTELEHIGHPPEEIDALLVRLAQLHRLALAARPPDFELPQDTVFEEAEVQDVAQDLSAGYDSPISLHEPEPPAEAQETRPPPEVQKPSGSDGFVIGAWVDLTTSGKLMRTQLTWCSPHNTLFLFTAPDGSTQSMTRRMRDKLVAGGALRVINAQRTTERALRSVGAAERDAPPPVV